jgi:hypothetical protein
MIEFCKTKKIYAECHVYPLMLSDVTLNVIMASVVAPL